MPLPTVSGVAVFNQTRDAICRRALRLIGAFASGETPGADEMQDCSDALNAMTKEWQADGLHLWAESEGLLLPQPGQVQYALGTGSSDAAGVLVNQTTTPTGATAGYSSFGVASIGPIANGDVIGIQNLTGGFTVSTVIDVAGPVVTIAGSGGVVGGAPVGGAIFSWHAQNQLVRPLRILSVRRLNLQSGIRVPLLGYSRLDFMALPNPTQTGTINTWFYDPQLGFGQFSVWQPPASPIQDVLTFTFMRPIDDWSTSANVGDFPAEWLSALAFNLAVEIAPEYDVPAARLQTVVAMAQDKKQTAQGFDKEAESVYFSAAPENGAWR